MYQNEAAAATGMGGGVHAVAGEVVLDGNAWVYRGDAYDGAGIYADGASLTLMNSQVGGNDAAHDGGGLYLANGSILTGTTSARIGRYGYPNNGRYGGGIYADGSSLTFEGTVAHNTASSRGGGIAALGASDVAIARATFQENTSVEYGGGIYAHDSTLTVDHTRMHRNAGERGGAIFQDGTNALTDLSDTLIYSNTSTTGFGAGIRAEDGAITMTHVTLAHNQYGAGYSQSSTNGYAYNSIAWGNELGGFWITSGPLTGACNIDQSGNVGIMDDAQFVNPGAGEDYHLQGTSPAVNLCGDGFLTDLDEILRPVGSGYDAGAYEYPYDVTLVPDNEGASLAGTVITYEHTLTNSGGVADTFTLTTDSTQGWTVGTDPTSTVTLSAGAALNVIASIAVPADAQPFDVDVTTIRATGASSALSATVRDTTTVACEPVTEVDFDYSPEEPETEETITFSAIYAPSNATGPVEYVWDFGDGVMKNGTTVTHSYAISATYPITLTVHNVCLNPAVEHTGYVRVIQSTRYIYLPLVIRNG
jgi:predicted outer membrane repeat protein